MTTIKDLFGNQLFETRSDFGDLFQKILKNSEQSSRQDLGTNLAGLIADNVQDLDIKKFPIHPHDYSRSYLGRDASGFESIVCRWESNAASSIHGHPDFVFYYVVSGVIEMPFFKVQPDGSLEKTGTKILRAGEWVSAQGKEGQFDNMIHQVKALEPSLSLHVFSDDALKGQVYS